MLCTASLSQSGIAYLLSSGFPQTLRDRPHDLPSVVPSCTLPCNKNGPLHSVDPSETTHCVNNANNINFCMPSIYF
ncbi:hypothetical protein VNO78_31021 [Psophocarpus tetragonolobus]|uniref:Uncharacterized protein n=1 Tax=Psophocarpus tetragonolobus TaxID=3891 RepID=A0AAN9X6T0_PSOTE